MSTVYEAYEAELERAVALKVLPAEFLHDDGTFARRFQQEARVVAALEHPHIVPLFASGIDNGIPWMSMRLLGGGNLGTLLAQESLPIERALGILRAVASALDHAHAHGVVHRDIKPSNVLLDTEGRVFVGDFGLAHIIERSLVHTRTGVIAGTPHYMAPEIGLGGTVDRRSDVYSLGVVAYEMLTGHPPFDAGSPVAILLKHANEPVPMPQGDRITRDVAHVLCKALAKDPADRWPTAGAFTEALDAAMAAPARRLTPGRAFAATAAVLGTLAVAVLLSMRSWGTNALPNPEPLLVRPAAPSTSTDIPAADVALPESIHAAPADVGSPKPIIGSPVLGRPPVAPSATPSSAAPQSTTPPRSVPVTSIGGGNEPAPPTERRPSAKAPPTSAIQESASDRESPTDQTPSLAAPPTRVEETSQPVRLDNVSPTYPPLARAAQIEGDVVLQATVQADGQVTDVQVVEPVHPLLDNAALEAVRQYRYEPGRRNGVPSPFPIKVTISFRLE